MADQRKKQFKIDEACTTKRKSHRFEWLFNKVFIFIKKKRINKISNKVKKNAWLMEEKTFRVHLNK